MVAEGGRRAVGDCADPISTRVATDIKTHTAISHVVYFILYAPFRFSTSTPSKAVEWLRSAALADACRVVRAVKIKKTAP